MHHEKTKHKILTEIFQWTWISLTVVCIGEDRTKTDQIVKKSFLEYYYYKNWIEDLQVAQPAKALAIKPTYVRCLSLHKRITSWRFPLTSTRVPW